jgi:uncharacterized RmlC-like cupin family protein
MHNPSPAVEDQDPGSSIALLHERSLREKHRRSQTGAHMGGAKTGPHHHGTLESVIYVISGRARMRWGERLEFVAEAGAGDFIYVPPFVPHQEINASRDEPLACVVVRNDQEPIVVNLAIHPAESPEEIHWVDDIHTHP